MYALGAVAYHCLAGHPPFRGDNPVMIATQHVSQDPEPLPEDVPLTARELVATALAKDPTARFPSAAAMARAAERAARAAEPTATTLRLSTVPEPPGRPPARTRGWIVAVLILVLLALSGVALALGMADTFGRDPAPPPATSVTASSVGPTKHASPTTGRHSPSPRPSTSPATTEPTPSIRPPTTTAPTTTAPTTTTTTTAPTTTARTTEPPPTTQGKP